MTTSDRDRKKENDSPSRGSQTTKVALPSNERALEVLVVGSDGRAETIPLEGYECTFGRAPECTVRVDDPGVSRRHAMVCWDPPTLSVTDLGSVNGTWLMNERLESNQPHELALGESVRMGGSVMIIQRVAPRARTRTLRTHGFFESRLVERCAEAGDRPFVVVRIRCATGGDVPAVADVLAANTDASDIVAAYSSTEYELLLPSHDRTKGKALILAVERDLRSRGISATVGMASYPDDAREAASLFAQAGESSLPPPDMGGRAWVSEHGALARMRPLLQRVASSRMNVLVLGETGAGKEIFAQTIHRLSPREGGPLVSFNCAALSEALLESELFGHERGAFTGATQAKQGLLESARGGTVFLDEIGEMPPTLQAKMLRVLEQREVMRVGAIKPTPIDVRFICATNRDLADEVALGTFRQDLYFRLNGISIVVPPLRERVGEIAFLAETFADEICRREGLPRPRLEPSAIEQLAGYSWPGNIRELRNIVERAVVVSGGGAITEIDLPAEKMAPALPNPTYRDLPPAFAPPLSSPPRRPPSSTSMPRAVRETIRVKMDAPTDEYAAVPETRTSAWQDERDRIVAALEQCGGNQTYAAKMLGMARSTFVTRLEMFDIVRPRKR